MKSKIYTFLKKYYWEPIFDLMFWFSTGMILFFWQVLAGFVMPESRAWVGNDDFSLSYALMLLGFFVVVVHPPVWAWRGREFTKG